MSVTLCIAGVDEVGRGAWFGPVVAAAVLLTFAQQQQLRLLGVRDSKQLSPQRRSDLAQEIHAIALSVQIAYATPRTIDRLNILQASLQTMSRAVNRLQPTPEHCLVDGSHQLPNLTCSQETLVKGDQQSIAIAAASIVAKVWRDTLIVRLSPHYPAYDLVNNKGYGTPKHRIALFEHGPTPLHRLSFRPCRLAQSTVGRPSVGRM
ncbi:MAG: ribonuclease HII [Spirulina sp. SIO3F2]|nr:ribonuclease HII [Spirulina sp. SIO3F2]